eukprot:6413628-Pyramimonas_sp.AAC.1
MAPAVLRMLPTLEPPKLIGVPGRDGAVLCALPQKRHTERNRLEGAIASSTRPAGCDGGHSLPHS